MSVPNVNCKILYIENEETLAKYPSRNERYGPKRKFYSCNQKQDYITYVDTGSKRKADYIAYTGDSEKSTGVFDKNGLMSFRERVLLREKLRTTKSVIWDCLLTFQPEFGQTYCNDFEQAYEMMKREMPRFLKDAGFNPDNITWFAGLHTNKRHRHIHISFFENEPTRIRKRSKELQYSLGKIHRACLDRFKIHVEQNLTDISAELRVARKEVTTLTQNVLFSKDSKIRYDREFQSLILRLSESLPSDGRLSYDSKNMRPLQSLIRQIADIAIKSNKEWHKSFLKFCGEVKKKDDETREMLIHSKVPEKYWNKYLKSEMYLNDLYRRMGNQILNYIRVYKKKEYPAKSRLARKRIRGKTAFDVMLHSAQLQAAMQTESAYFFEEYLKKLEESREENEQGVMELNEME